MTEYDQGICTKVQVSLRDDVYALLVQNYILAKISTEKGLSGLPIIIPSSLEYILLSNSK